MFTRTHRYRNSTSCSRVLSAVGRWRLSFPTEGRVILHVEEKRCVFTRDDKAHPSTNCCDAKQRNVSLNGRTDPAIMRQRATAAAVCAHPPLLFASTEGVTLKIGCKGLVTLMLHFHDMQYSNGCI